MVRARDDEADVRDDIDVSAEEAVDDMAMLEDAPFTEAAFNEDDEVPPDPTVRRRRLRWYVLGGAATLVLVLGVVLGPTAWLLLTHPKAHLATPDRLAGLTLDRSADGQATADYLRTAVAASVSLDTSVGAVYDDPGDRQRSVMFFGGTGMLLSPDKDLADVFQLLDDQGGTMKDVHSVPPGKLGGEMKCGTSTGDGGDMTVCGWADHGSIALALFPGRSIPDAAALMTQMRDGIQTNDA